MENFENGIAMCANGITNLATKTDEMDKAMKKHVATLMTTPRTWLDVGWFNISDS